MPLSCGSSVTLQNEKSKNEVMKKALTLTLLLSAFLGKLEAQVVLQDSFPYANGILTNVSGNLWTNYSGTIDSTVNNGQLEVFGTRAGDVFRPFTNASGGTLFASFTVNATNLSNSTNYLAHFSANATTFRGKVFAAGPGSAPNSWRLGVSAAGNAGTQAILERDLAT